MTPRFLKVIRYSLLAGVPLTALGLLAVSRGLWVPRWLIVPGWAFADALKFDAPFFWAIVAAGQMSYYFLAGALLSLFMFMWSPEPPPEPAAGAEPPPPFRYGATTSLLMSMAGYTSFFVAVEMRTDRSGLVIPVLCFLAAPVLSVYSFACDREPKVLKGFSLVAALLPWLLAVVYYKLVS